MLSTDVSLILSSYLNWKEILKTKQLSTKNFFNLDKPLAAIQIYKLWYIKKTELWINLIISEILKRHAFYWRTHTNLIDFVDNMDIRLPAPVFQAKKVQRKRKHIILKNWAICPFCNWNDVDTAIFYAVGTSMQHSTPVLDFCCKVCVYKIDIDFYDIYMSPYFKSYGEDSWAKLNMHGLADFEEITIF
tara:strand:- start:37 stop:603 length:567 start_codon:yes stop_codon:yes gene_type:complete